jgi:hypothetical protein
LLHHLGARLGRKHIYAACFSLHFLLVLLVSLRQEFSDLSLDITILPRHWDPALLRAQDVFSTALGDNLRAANPLHEAVAAYTYSAGIDSGYGFFAPSVAVSHKLVFEITYPDGRVEYELPRVGAGATGVRLPLLLDNIARTQYDLLRETIFKVMAFSVWREHPDASVIRTVFGFMNIPGVRDFEHGKKETYEVLYAYDFRFAPSPKPR